MRITNKIKADLMEFMTEGQIEKELAARKFKMDMVVREAEGRELSFMYEMIRDNNLNVTYDTNQDEYRKAFVIAYVLSDVGQKVIEKIARNVARDVVGIISHEDIMQYVTMQLWEKPHLVTNAVFIHGKFKLAALDAIKKEVRRYRKGFAVSNIDGVVLNNQKYAYDDDVSGIGAMDFRTDMKELLSETEYKVFYNFYVKDMSMLEVDKIIGQRCDRILKSVKTKVRGYYEQGTKNLVI